MNTYKIEELQTFNSTREPTIIKSKNLRCAKIKATKSQAFYGTVLKIYDELGNLLSHKAPSIGGATENWQDH